jgi:hypothetical protein
MEKTDTEVILDAYKDYMPRHQRFKDMVRADVNLTICTKVMLNKENIAASWR